MGGGGIEMSACGFEIRSIALGVLMKVYGVLAGREILEGELNANTLCNWLDGGGSDGGAFGVSEGDNL
jgi:hypothetical protein